MTDVIRAYAWYSAYPGNRNASPPRAAVRHMLTEINDELKARNLRPTGLSCQRWPSAVFHAETGDDYLSCIAVMTEPGGLARPFASWFEWQHPRWQVAMAPPPMIERAAPIVEGVVP